LLFLLSRVNKITEPINLKLESEKWLLIDNCHDDLFSKLGCWFGKRFRNDL